MTQLTLALGLLPESVSMPPVPLTAALQRALVTQMAAAIIAVYHAGGALPDDHCTPSSQNHFPVSVNSFLDTFGPKIRLPQPRHTVAHVSPGRVLCIHAAQSARSHCIDAETRAAPGGGPPPYQRS